MDEFEFEEQHTESDETDEAEGARVIFSREDLSDAIGKGHGDRFA